MMMMMMMMMLVVVVVVICMHESSESIEATPHPWGNWSRSGPRRRAVFSHSSFLLPGGSLMTLEGMV